MSNLRPLHGPITALSSLLPNRRTFVRQSCTSEPKGQHNLKRTERLGSMLVCGCFLPRYVPQAVLRNLVSREAAPCSCSHTYDGFGSGRVVVLHGRVARSCETRSIRFVGDSFPWPLQGLIAPPKVGLGLEMGMAAPENERGPTNSQPRFSLGGGC